MLKKRIIVCLDVMNNRVVKGVQFEGLKDMGDPVKKAEEYNEHGADELVFLDITASAESRKTRFSWVEKVASRIHIPFTVGGGISSAEEARILLKSGADKVSINTAALLRPDLIDELAGMLGSQSVVIAIDVKKENGTYYVYSHGGKKATGIRFQEWLPLCQKKGAGEFLITSIDADGTRNGFDLELYQQTGALADLPFIASGGAGSMEHFAELFQNTRATGALAAGIFHDGSVKIPELKKYLQKKQIPVRI